MDNSDKLAMVYINDGKDEAVIKALAVIAGAVDALGYETVSRVFIDFSMYCIPEDEYKEFLANIVTDNGYVEA